MPNMTLSYLIFPTGGIAAGSPVPGLPLPTSLPLAPPPAQANPLTAPPLEPPAPAQAEYVFEYWNIDGQLYVTPTAPPPPTWPVPSNDFSATAWYFSGGGIPQPLITTYAFSLNTNEVIVGKTPISSVVGAPWTSPSTTVPTNTSPNNIVVTAEPLIGGFGKFVSWLAVGGASISGATLTAPANSDINAVAFYGIPVPDPCENLREQLENFSPGDFLNQQEAEAFRAALVKALLACERQYGEIPLPK